MASSPRIDSSRLTDNQPIFDQLPDLLVGTSSGNFIGLIGVQADLPFCLSRKHKRQAFFEGLSILTAMAGAAKGKVAKKILMCYLFGLS